MPHTSTSTHIDLALAILNDDHAKTKELFNAGASFQTNMDIKPGGDIKPPPYIHPGRYNCLDLALIKGQAELVRLFLNHEILIKRQCIYRDTFLERCLSIALEYQNMPMVDLLFEYDPYEQLSPEKRAKKRAKDINYFYATIYQNSMSNKISGILQLVYQQSWEFIIALVKKYPRELRNNNFCSAALWFVVQQNQLECAKALLEAGASANPTNDWRTDRLYPHTLGKFLKKLGINPSLANNHSTCLKIAVINKNYAMAVLLKEGPSFFDTCYLDSRHAFVPALLAISQMPFTQLPAVTLNLILNFLPFHTPRTIEEQKSSMAVIRLKIIQNMRQTAPEQLVFLKECVQTGALNNRPADIQELELKLQTSLPVTTLDESKGESKSIPEESHNRSIINTYRSLSVFAKKAANAQSIITNKIPQQKKIVGDMQAQVEKFKEAYRNLKDTGKLQNSDELDTQLARLAKDLQEFSTHLASDPKNKNRCPLPLAIKQHKGIIESLKITLPGENDLQTFCENYLTNLDKLGMLECTLNLNVPTLKFG